MDPVRSVLDQRRRLDAVFSQSLVLSGSVHGLAFIATALVVLLSPAPKLINVVDGFAVQIPRGGGGPPAVPDPPAPLATPDAPAAPKATPPPLLKPERPREKKGLTPNIKAAERKPAPAPAPKASQRPAAAPTKGTPQPAPSAEEAGLALAPSGAGSPIGTDAMGDLYLAGVQRRIWARWQGELRPDAHPPVTVSFVILANGDVTEVSIVQPSGSSVIDRAAQRAVLLAGPFSPLPVSLGKDRYVIHATFRSIG